MWGASLSSVVLAQSSGVQSTGVPPPSLQTSRWHSAQPLWNGSPPSPQLALWYGAQPESHVTPYCVCLRRQVSVPFCFMNSHAWPSLPPSHAPSGSPHESSGCGESEAESSTEVWEKSLPPLQMQ